MRLCRRSTWGLCSSCGDDGEVLTPMPLLGRPDTWSDWSRHPALEYYTPLAVVGSGAFSKVYRGRCHDSGDEVAMKVVYRNKPNVKPGHWKVLRNEVLMLERMDHPNIVKMLEYFEDTEQLVIILEMLNGGEILAHLKVISKYSERAAANLFRQKLTALAHLHARGIIHRDIKPENVILQRRSNGSDGASSNDQDSSHLTIKMIDLGVACDLGAKGPEPRGVIGTIGFVAPEVCLMLPHTPAMDIWSMGVMLYIMLCGSLPYTNRQLEMMSYVNIPFRRSEGYEAEEFMSLSASARQMIIRMLTHSPEHRATAEELLQHTWLTQVNPPEVVLPRVSTGARNVATYRSSRGMANCVVVDPPLAPTESGHLTSDRDSDAELVRSSLVSMDTERKISTRQLGFNPDQFLDNFHEDIARGSKAMRQSEGPTRQRRVGLGALEGRVGRWSDNLLNGFSSDAVENMLRKRHGSIQGDGLNVVDEEPQQFKLPTAMQMSSEFNAGASFEGQQSEGQPVLRRTNSAAK